MKLRSATLAEVLAAMGIIALVFGMGAMAWLNFSGKASPKTLNDARLRARSLILAAESRPEPSVTEAGGRKYIREIVPINASRGLYKVTVDCFAGDDKLFSRSKIIHADAP